MGESHPSTSAQDPIENVWKSYNEGTKLFPRDVLEDLNRQLKQSKDCVFINDFYGCKRKHNVKVPSSLPGYAPRIYYGSIERLTQLCPTDQPAREVRFPLSISFTKYSNKKPHYTFSEASRELEQHHRMWSNSSTCASLNSFLTSATFTVPVEKVVCFGLGSLGRLSGQPPRDRSFWQHLAAMTMANTIAKVNRSEVLCYCQDPMYDEVDKDLLKSIGIIPINDPEGFLEVGSETLVFSVSPNVPVKQIVVDIAWPSAMLWNTVSPKPEKEEEWKKIKDGEEETWLCPFTTDPDSPRVRSMIEHYDNYELPDPTDHFGDLTLYIKRVTSPE